MTALAVHGDTIGTGSAGHILNPGNQPGPSEVRFSLAYIGSLHLSRADTHADHLLDVRLHAVEAREVAPIPSSGRSSVVYGIAALLGVLLAVVGVVGGVIKPGSAFLGIAAAGFALMALVGYFTPEDASKAGASH
jgi:hypothetical protein